MGATRTCYDPSARVLARAARPRRCHSMRGGSLSSTPCTTRAAAPLSLGPGWSWPVRRTRGTGNPTQGRDDVRFLVGLRPHAVGPGATRGRRQGEAVVDSEVDTDAVTEFLDPLVLRARTRLGTLLRDKWRLDALLGVGGMAAVY